MLSIIVESCGPVDIDEGVYNGAQIEDWWTDPFKMYVQLAVPVDEIDAEYTCVEESQNYEMWGAPHFVSNMEIQVHHCLWSPNGQPHRVINDLDTCWRIVENER